MALKLTLVLPAATVAEAGTARTELLSDTETTTPPVGAALDIVTVQVLTPPDANVVGLHAIEETVGGGAVGGFKTTATDCAVPAYEAVIASVCTVLTAAAVAAKLAVVAPAGTVTWEGTVRGAAVDEAGRISQILRLNRSVVGAVSLIVTTVPLSAVGPFCIWTQ